VRDLAVREGERERKEDEEATGLGWFFSSVLFLVFFERADCFLFWSTLARAM